MEPLDETLSGQAQVWKHMFAVADSMALKCAVELRIPDIIHSQAGGPVTLAQIASRFPTPSPKTAYLARVMRLLVRKNIFSAHRDGGEMLYGLAPSSRWLLQDASHLSLAPMVLLQGHPTVVSAWHYLGDCVKDEGSAGFKRANGHDLWDLQLENPEYNRIFNDAMACTNKFMMKAIVDACKEGFERVGSLVDVGGGTGVAVAEIVRSYPHIKGINFDRPNVIADAPVCGGVSHVGGDMFEAIPSADAVFMKWILHDWNDEDCVKILKNCKKAIPEKNGMVLIAEVVLQPEGDGLFDETGLVLDLLMITHTGGKERSELEWKKILEEGGFPRYNIVQIPSLLSVIEAFPL
ncbi:xanthohumol 4-O-methyltransferase-like [Rhodamnia argentea]|uniref:Xanthohumol 4-O-methyltransferase-like n=1 Tax=Rhodamnia argentea TaxID=178133 RepID=A0ABM3HML2_9MYRT|nr:xanthohumol 4-O-methyltransferase-like [Rhodamnia argentea]XP_048137841.1 xanthohumol 4-O-methyltransferase-like [Rhodamnia argentea]